jgi:glycosyltransferase involved in cell wall biosynthesis
MRILHVIASVNFESGGPSQSVTQLTRYLAERGEKTRLISLNYGASGDVQTIGTAEMELIPAQFAALRFRGFSKQLATRIDTVAGNCDVIHNHGLWMWPNVYARSAAVHNRKPLVTSPRGMLDQWALRRSRVKKALFWHLYERKNLSRVALFHATSYQEAASIRKLEFRQPIAVIPNAVELPHLDRIPNRAFLEHKFPALQNKRWLLFLSRLHAKKGIRELLDVWQEIHHDFREWQLVIAGSPTTDDGPAIVDQIIRRSLSESVTTVGHLVDDRKACALHHSDLFVLPSFSENFGIAIAEALAHATPVITTTATPWRDLPDFSAGWCIQPNIEDLKKTLPLAMSHDKDELAEMGRRGRQMIATRHNWAKVADDMARSYEWLLNQNNAKKPDFILTNGVAT